MAEENTKTESIANKEEKLIRDFQVQLFEEEVDDRSGESMYVPDPSGPFTVSADSKEDLQMQLSQFKTPTSYAKVIKEITPLERIKKFAKKMNPKAVEEKTQTEKPAVIASNQNTAEIIQSPVASAKVTVHSAKPKYYTIGGIEVKEVDGKIFQRQWMQLTQQEAANIRLISDKTNQLVNTNGKHYEIKKWIQIETTDEDSSGNSSVEEMIK